MKLGLTGKTALVLASSKGLGKASALALAGEGANVVISGRNDKTLQEAAINIREQSQGTVRAIPADVTNLADLERLIAETAKAFGAIDILVTNAGGPTPGTFEATSDAEWQKAFELTLLSTVRAIRLVLPHMKPTGSGRIINLTSLSVKQPIENLLLSNSLRAGVVGMAKTLSNELGPSNITVNNICTGLFPTDRLRQTRRIDEKIQSGLTEAAAWEDTIKGIPLGRLGKLEEFGALVTFLASEPAAYITGTSIPIDGGANRSLL